ncbi:uncharacterized protein Dwil_GK18212 [Drosophila willistoni]|uniref:Protein croquemort n=1 Tax=Drosophila willistoni TaxID=7260 RepID=B4MYT6_DROWI|nr:protein croquemort [Drosophila willistoni]EDW77275.1 uncharacterized protein Dwil_GK18212 [Drosophila willistoni]
MCCCNCCSVRQQKIWVFGLGAFTGIVGLVMIAAWPSIAKAFMYSFLPLAPNSFMYKRWVTTPAPVYSTFYLFNWTNPEDLNNDKVKPNFQQVGPYTFSDYKVKEDLDWEQPQVTYYGRRVWHFLSDKSPGQSLDDIIITPHFPTVTAAKYARKYRRIVRKIINFAVNREGGGTFMKHTAGENIFDGYYDSLIDFAEQLHSPLLPFYSSNFGWFYGRNNSKTAEGSFTIHTGHKDLSLMGEMLRWNGSDHTGYYQGECGRVNGSTGELWAPLRKWDETISIFLSDAARYFNFYAKTKVSHRGIKSWRYETDQRTFDNGQLAPDTACFCVPKRDCPMNGVVDFSPAAYNAPIYMSHPHFYLTDPSYRENTTGLSPNATEHGMYLIMEPTFGIPLKVMGQVMISVLVQRDDDIDLLNNVAYNHYAPLFVLQMHAELDDDLISLLKSGLIGFSIGRYIGIGILIAGLALIIIGLCLNRHNKWHNNDKEPIVDGKKSIKST